MKTGFRLIFAFLFSMLFMNCRSPGSRPQALKTARYSELSTPQLYSAVPDKESAPDAFKPLNQSSVRARMVIKTAEVRIEIQKYEETLSRIQQITSKYGGYVVTTRVQADETDKKNGTVVIRIPSERFQSALKEIHNLARKVEVEDIRGNDITEEYYDLEARLENKRKAEKRYQDILEEAKTAKEILEIEKALTDVREEIDRFTARKRYLNDQVAMSTIEIYMHEPNPFTGSGSNGFWANVKNGFQNGLNGFASITGFMITLIIALIPAVVIIALIAIPIKKFWRRMKPKKGFFKRKK